MNRPTVLSLSIVCLGRSESPRSLYFLSVSVFDATAEQSPAFVSIRRGTLMLIRTVGSIEIDRPIDEVFKYTNHQTAEWSLTVAEDEVLEQKNDGGAGTTFRCITEDRGQRMEFLGEVTRWEPPHLSEVFLTGRSFDIEAEYTFEDLGGRTRVTQASRVFPKGLMMKAFFFVASPFMKKGSCAALQKELNSLKQHAEAA